MQTKGLVAYAPLGELQLKDYDSTPFSGPQFSSFAFQPSETLGVGSTCS